MNDAWRGDHNLPTHAQGIKLLGTPLQHADFVQRKLAEKIDEYRVLLHRITQVSDLQCAWLLLLFCAASRANYVLRVVHPALIFQFAVQHDVGMRQCLQELLDVPVTQGMWEMAGLPFARRRATPDHSLLGQLGRHSSDDPRTPSRSRRPHGLVTLTRSWRIPIWREPRSAETVWSQPRLPP